MKIAQLTGIRQIKPNIPLYYGIVQVGMKLEVLFQHLLSVFYKSHSRFESNLMLNNGHLLSERIFFHFSFFQLSWNAFLTLPAFFAETFSNNGGILSESQNSGIRTW